MFQERNIELVVIGGGPLERELRTKVKALLGQRLRWLGQLPMHEVARHMASADTLILPSRFDGWGAVVSEALMAGTPAVCSDRCGAAEAVTASGCGAVFRSGDAADLARCIGNIVQEGPLSPWRAVALAEWAHSLGTAAGAEYLEGVLDHLDGRASRPTSPWRESSTVRVTSRATESGCTERSGIQV